MEPIVYYTMINAYRTSHWPCHEHSAEKRVMLKAAHTDHCELPYEKEKFLRRKLTTVYVRLVWDAPHLSRRVLRADFVEYSSE